MDWAIFFGIAAILVTIDLWGFEREAHEPSLLESSLKTVFVVLVACSFGLWLIVERGADAGLQFFTGYVLESSLSFDNVFVISLILGALSIPKAYRSFVLFCGIAGAMVLRGAFIGAGASLVSQFHWVLWGFAAFLIYTGVKMLVSGEDEGEYDIESNRTLRLLRHYLPITKVLHGKALFWKGVMTPLMVAIILVEVADVVFAVDSIPAIFAVTTDPFIIFTSNIFAIVGLRSLFFVLEALVKQFLYLETALSAVLVFIGARVLAGDFLHIDIPTPVSLGIVLAILCAGVIASLIRGDASPKG